MTEEETKEPVEEEKKEEAEKPLSKAEIHKQNIKETNEATDRMEEANKKREELIAAEQEANVEKTFDGKADAGEGRKEETAEEYKDKVMSGEIK